MNRRKQAIHQLSGYRIKLNVQKEKQSRKIETVTFFSEVPEFETLAGFLSPEIQIR